MKDCCQLETIPVDESAARAIADGATRTRYGERAELLGVTRIDRDALTAFLADQCRRGRVALAESQLRAAVDYFKVRPCRPRWVASYLVFGAGPGEPPTVATVTVDDETGGTDFEADVRP
jgi:hypothetical protein